MCRHLPGSARLIGICMREGRSWESPGAPAERISRRAVLESIAYQVSDLVFAMREDSGIELSTLRVDGGASVSDVLMQFQADILDACVDRPKNIETTALGAAFMAGLACGFWPDRESLLKCRDSEHIFTPNMEEIRRNELYSVWRRAVARSRSWAE